MVELVVELDEGRSPIGLADLVSVLARVDADELADLSPARVDGVVWRPGIEPRRALVSAVVAPGRLRMARLPQANGLGVHFRRGEVLVDDGHDAVGDEAVTLGAQMMGIGREEVLVHGLPRRRREREGVDLSSDVEDVLSDGVHLSTVADKADLVAVVGVGTRPSLPRPIGGGVVEHLPELGLHLTTLHGGHLEDVTRSFAGAGVEEVVAETP